MIYMYHIKYGVPAYNSSLMLHDMEPQSGVYTESDKLNFKNKSNGLLAMNSHTHTIVGVVCHMQSYLKKIS